MCIYVYVCVWPVSLYPPVLDQLLMHTYVRARYVRTCTYKLASPIQLRLTVWTLAKTSITFRLMSDVGTGPPISRETDRPNLQMFARVHRPPLFYRPTTGSRDPSTAGQASFEAGSSRSRRVNLLSFFSSPTFFLLSKGTQGL